MDILVPLACIDTAHSIPSGKMTLLVQEIVLKSNNN